jgi:peptide deformylase
MSMDLKIAQLGQPVLRALAEEVSPEDIQKHEFQEFLNNMRETLRSAEGVGLAAPQVYCSRQVFLAAILPPPTEEEPPGVETFINPRIVPLSEEVGSAWEGCLSFPELMVLVPRSRKVRIDYLNAQGRARALELEGFPARVVQHEFDHLQGVLTLDRAQSTRDIIKTSEADEVLPTKNSSSS